MASYWWLTALLTGFVNAGYIYVNQIYKMNGMLLMLYRGFVVALIMLPAVLLSAPITDWRFYLFCILQGGIIAFNDYRFFRATKAFGAEVSGSIHPLSVSLMFVLWLLVTPSQLWYFAEHYWRFAAVVLCLGGIIAAVLRLRNAKASRRALGYLLPVLAVLACGDIVNKKAMQYGAENLFSAVVYYSFVTGIVCGLCSLAVYLHRRRPLAPVFEKRNLLRGSVVAVMVIVLMIFKNVSMYLTPNPAYVSAIILLYPLWIMGGDNIYLKLTGRKGGYATVSPKLLLMLVCSVIGLILLNR